MSDRKLLILNVATFSGTIIGVGLFSLPYIALKVGFWVMFFYFIVLGALIYLVHKYFGEVAIKTPDFKRYPGFAKYYLGDWGEKIAFISSIIGTFGALLAYLIVGGEFLTQLLSPIFGGDNLIYTFIYFFIGALFIFLGIKAIQKIEFLGLILFSVILVLIFWAGKDFINIGNLFLHNPLNLKNFFLPYGAIIFSLSGISLIPEIEENLKDKKNLLTKIIFISILIPIIIYLFFIFLILGICGENTTETALTGLVDFLGYRIAVLGYLFGLITTFTSFITMGLTLKKIFHYDLKLNKKLSWFITCFIPLFLFLIGVNQFIPVISFVGGVMCGIDGILILLMYKKINPQKKIIYPLSLIFILGIIYEIVYFVK